MSEGVFSISEVDMSKVTLSNPRPVQGGSYVTSIVYNNSPNTDCLIQLPKCFTKQGIVERGRRNYCDLMYEASDSTVLEWIEKVNAKCQQLIYEKRNTWFTSNLSEDDIETAFTSPIRLYQSGKNYLLRVHIKNSRESKPEIVYSESGEVMGLEEVTPNQQLIPMVKLDCIRFATRSFSLEISLSQMMILKGEVKSRGCLITREIKSIGEDKSRNRQDEGDTAGEIVNMNQEEGSTFSNLENSKEIDVGDGAPEAIEEKMISELKEPEDNPDVDRPLGEGLVQGKQESENKTVEEHEHPVLDSSLSKTENDIGLQEVSELEIEEDDSPIELTHPAEVYKEIYRAAVQKARLAKKAAVEAHLEARRIKNTYLIGDMDSSDEEDVEDQS